MYIGDTILGCRRDTNNTDTTSIDTEDFLRYLNFAQENVQAIILQAQSQKFQYEVLFNITASQDAYALPDNTYMGDRIVNVEYSYTGQERDYIKIYERGISYRNTYPQPYVTSYIRRSGQILVQPMPQATQGLLRVTAERQIDRVDIRRAVVDSVTTGGGGTTLTALSVNPADANYPADTTAIAAMLLTNPYICISNVVGAVQVYNIPVSAYNAGSGDLTISGTFTFGENDTIPVSGNYITFGKYSRTHSELDLMCERYLTAYCNWKILGRDTAGIKKADYFESELKLIKAEIIQSYSETDHDEDEIQIVNPDLL